MKAPATIKAKISLRKNAPSNPGQKYYHITRTTPKVKDIIKVRTLLSIKNSIKS
jgi:hypothetical protein